MNPIGLPATGQQADGENLTNSHTFNLYVPASGQEWAEQELSLDAFPVGCGVAGCETCNKAADQKVRERRARLIAECLRFIEETGDGLLPYVLVEALQTHPNVYAYCDHMHGIVPFRSDEEFKSVADQRVRFYSLLREDFLMHIPFVHHGSPSAFDQSDDSSAPGEGA